MVEQQCIHCGKKSENVLLGGVLVNPGHDFFEYGNIILEKEHGNLVIPHVKLPVCRECYDKKRKNEMEQNSRF